MRKAQERVQVGRKGYETETEEQGKGQRNRRRAEKSQNATVAADSVQRVHNKRMCANIKPRHMQSTIRLQQSLEHENSSGDILG